MTPASILTEARRAGVTLRRNGDRITIAPASLCPPDLIEAIRENKPRLMRLLEAEASSLPADCKGWLCVARQILAGEFEGADRSTRESLIIGLRGINHAVCREALKRITAAKYQP